jgi:hypothetical protein
MRIALADHGLRFAQVFVVAVERFFQLVEFALGEPAQIAFDDRSAMRRVTSGTPGMRRICSARHSDGAARADADRVQALHQRQRAAQFVDFDFELGGQARVDLVELLFQVAVVVDGVDHSSASARSRAERR